MIDNIVSLLGDKAEYLLQHNCQTIPTKLLHLPGPDWVDRIFAPSNRNQRVLNNLNWMYNTGRLAGTGYCPFSRSIRASSIRRGQLCEEPALLRSREHRQARHRRRLQRRGINLRRSGQRSRANMRTRFPSWSRSTTTNCSPIRTSIRRFFSARSNRPTTWARRPSGATIYFGSDDASREIIEIARSLRAGARARAWPRCSGATCATMPSRRTRIIIVSADLTGQANHLGCTIQADIIKQKLPENNGGYKALNTGGSSYGKLDERIYTELTSDHPIDLCRYQVANCYMGRAGLINSGGASGEQRFCRRRVHRGDQQARGRHGPDLRSQGVPAPDGGRGQAPEHDPRRLSLQRGHYRLSEPKVSFGRKTQGRR